MVLVEKVLHNAQFENRIFTKFNATVNNAVNLASFAFFV
jgi:hypothetical protein